jgi:hypothetical protein
LDQFKKVKIKLEDRRAASSGEGGLDFIDQAWNQWGCEERAQQRNDFENGENGVH